MKGKEMNMRPEVVTVPCTQCGGKGIVGSPSATVSHDTCDRCKGDGKLHLHGWVRERDNVQG